MKCLTEENDTVFESLLKRYRPYYINNFNLFKYQSGLFPSVYFEIFDYVQKMNISEKDIHKLSYNLRYNENISNTECNKYISFLTASAFLCSMNDENFYRLKRVWPYDNNYKNMAHYIDLSNLEEEILTHESKRYHYIYVLIFQRIAEHVHKQISEQWHLSDEQNRLRYDYNLVIPQYVVTLSGEVFKIYECV